MMSGESEEGVANLQPISSTIQCSQALNSKVWYIMDGQHPTKYGVKTILVSSLKKNHYKNFDKWGRNWLIWFIKTYMASLTSNLLDHST
ncbi:unnamed protein product [Rhizophagus irregularis]|nr:unnamed protein product [Rhizophagus irregularis]